MDDTNKNKSSNLWFGFALGMTASGALMYFLGTSKGREKLKRLIEFAENTNFEEYLESLADKIGDGTEKAKGAVNSGLDNLIDKIQSFSSHESHEKKKRG